MGASRAPRGRAPPAFLKSTRAQAESRRPNPESLARPSGRGRGPKTENREPFLSFSPQKWSGYIRRPKAEGRIPKAWPGPAGGAGARRPKTENRFCNFRPKKGPGTSEDRKPKAESRKLGPAHPEHPRLKKSIAIEIFKRHLKICKIQ